jgi:hypothetical protein
MTPEFKNRAEYLAWRATWRLQYGTLSRDIREHKQLRRSVGDLDRPGVQSTLERRKERARALIQDLENARVLAAQQMGRPRRYRHEWVWDRKFHQWVWYRLDVPLVTAEAAD